MKNLGTRCPTPRDEFTVVGRRETAPEPVTWYDTAIVNDGANWDRSGQVEFRYKS